MKGTIKKEFKRILCPIDYSDASDSAVELAAAFAQHQKAELVLLEIVEAPVLQDASNIRIGFPSESESREKDAKEMLNEYCNTIAKDFSIECSGLTKSYLMGLDQALSKVIERNHYDLVIMGTKGADDLRTFYFGTHTYHIIRNISVPLIIVPENYIFSPLKKVVFATDYKPQDVEFIKKTLELTKDFNPELTILHISSRDSEISNHVFNSHEQNFRNSIDYEKLKVERVIDQNISLGINEFMASHKGNLLVLQTRDYNFIERIFKHSVVRDFSFIASYPVLVYRV